MIFRTFTVETVQLLAAARKRIFDRGGGLVGHPFFKDRIRLAGSLSRRCTTGDVLASPGIAAFFFVHYPSSSELEAPPVTQQKGRKELPKERSAVAAGGQVGTLLVLGAARSGKSRYAQLVAQNSGRKPTFIATADAGDGEMAARIFAHRAERGPSWNTIEAPMDVAEALSSASKPDNIVLLDCLTLWVSNLIFNGRDTDAETRRLADMIPRLAGPVIFVSNEVGASVVPDNKLARQFIDAQGRLNQAVASACDTVVLVAAGLPLMLKPTSAKAPKFN